MPSIDLFEHVGCFEPEFVERTGKSPRRAPGLGDFAIAAQDAVIAAQNAVVAAEALGLGSCYIGDIVENAEEVAELLDLPPYTMPLSMLIIGTPRKERPAIAHSVVNLVHEESATAARMPRPWMHRWPRWMRCFARMPARWGSASWTSIYPQAHESLYGRDEPLYGVVVQKLARQVADVTKGQSLCHIPYRRGSLKTVYKCLSSWEKQCIKNMGRLPTIPSNIKVGRKPAMEQKAKGGSLARCDSCGSISAMLVTLGVVYGDIGTSPMYVTKALVAGSSGIGKRHGRFVLGALSLSCGRSRC